MKGKFINRGMSKALKIGFVLYPLKNEVTHCIQEMIEQAFMAGQANEGVDPSYSSARIYSHKVLEGNDQNG